jgi:hypothetical protein
MFPLQQKCCRSARQRSANHRNIIALALQSMDQS